MAAVSADERHRPRGAAAVPALPERPALAPGPGGRPAAAGVRGGHGARELRRAAQRQPAQSAPAEPVHRPAAAHLAVRGPAGGAAAGELRDLRRSEEHTSELQSRFDLVCRLLLEKKKNIKIQSIENT